LTRAENIQQDNLVSQGQGTGEFGGEVHGAAVQVGLEYSDDASGVGRLNEFLSGGEHCGDFGRVVRVIVVDLHSARFTVILKTAAHTVEVGDTSDDLLQVRAQERTDRKSTRLNSSHVSISYAV